MIELAKDDRFGYADPIGKAPTSRLDWTPVMKAYSEAWERAIEATRKALWNDMYGSKKRQLHLLNGDLI
jgi:hypothetical protein